MKTVGGERDGALAPVVDRCLHVAIGGRQEVTKLFAARERRRRRDDRRRCFDNVGVAFGCTAAARRTRGAARPAAARGRAAVIASAAAACRTSETSCAGREGAALSG